MKKILYIGWIGYNNLGDDLLWNIFQSLCIKHQFDEKKIQIVPSFPGVDLEQVEDYDAVVLGGGSLIAPKYIRILKKALDLNKKVIIWGSGIDRISEKYLKSIKSGSSLHLEERFTKKDAEFLKYVFSKASFTGVRGPLTKQALEDLGVTTKHIQIIGDPGVLLCPTIDLKQKEKLIGINWGTTNGSNIYGHSEKLVEKQLVETAKALIDKGYKLLIYSVWDKDHRVCQRLYNKINNHEMVTLDKNLYNEEELMSLLSSCILTINFKLHSNLLSLSAGVPCIALGYRYKVFDLVQSLSLENYVLSTSNKNLKEDILKRIHLIEKNNYNIINKYKKKKHYYSPLLEKPFNDHFYLD